MIYRLKLSNYYSVRESVEIDLRIPDTSPGLSFFRRRAGTGSISRLPTVVVFMGPNGAGKTTLLRAIIDVAQFICRFPAAQGHPPASLFIPFNSKEFTTKPTEICADLDANWMGSEKPELFRYELSIGRDKLDKQGRPKPYVLKETLLHFPRGRPRRIFSRHAPGEPIYIAKEFGITKSDDRLKAVRDDASVISTLNFLNVPLARDIAADVEGFLCGTSIKPQGINEFSTEKIIEVLCRHPDVKEWTMKQMQSSDLAIRDMQIGHATGGQPYVYFDHFGLDKPVPLFMESGGTKRLFHLLPQIKLALVTGRSAVLDEIDGYLHVDIVSDIFHEFRSLETNPRDAQLMVASHHTGLLDDLEKEELYIVEKNRHSATCVYGAKDIQGLRRDTKLYPKYRAGALGGIPSIG